MRPLKVCACSGSQKKRDPLRNEQMAEMSQWSKLSAPAGPFFCVLRIIFW
ncbi:hypothetical protein SAMD00019534_055160 [Acytostelium subglobosum LB1]|nr:hypothetical protein SAMD00019534_055160 [Acytostelium subglobosum LB1]GAM22341.1 hypothetical protein SAMD00019534_055160 [Acytostelium subglobosum LB1]|eukprot:XP_012754461.1 hypothetical protein SAMD00019534_055160 [Acytostelium subglobosum LB1]